jgi:methyl-accepting chemotaxis protein
MLMFFQASNPLAPIWQYGAATGSAFICVGLLIWSQIQIATFKTTVDANTKTLTESNQEVTKSNQELTKLIQAQSQAQDKLVESVHQLAEGVKAQADVHHEQLDLIREMAVEQRVLSANQLTIMNGFQRVVEQLIGAIRE